MTIEVEIEGKKYGFAYNSRTDFYLGDIKRKLGYKPNDDVEVMVAIFMRHYAALRSFGFLKNGLAENYDFEAWLDLVDKITDADQDRMMEASTAGMGFSSTVQMKMMTSMAETIVQNQITVGLNGKSNGSLEKEPLLAD